MPTLNLLRDWGGKQNAKLIATLASGESLEGESGFSAFPDNSLSNALVLRQLLPSPTSDSQSYMRRRAERADRLRKIYTEAYREPLIPLLWVVFQSAYLDEFSQFEPGAFSSSQRRIAQDLRVIALPVLKFLGLWELYHQFGELIIKVLEPERYREFSDAIRVRHKLSEAYGNVIRSSAQKWLDEVSLNGVELIIRQNRIGTLDRWLGKGENIQSIVRRIRIDVVVRDRIDIDIVARHIISGIRHANDWEAHSLNDSDNTSVVKYNGYRARTLSCVYAGLKTEDKSFGSDHGPISVKFYITTNEMREINDHGIVAARFLYPNSNPISVPGAWWESRETNPAINCLQNVSSGQNAPVVFFSPRGELYMLPQGSTPIDFAFVIHRDVGAHVKRCWVNGRLVHPNTHLITGDLVEIDTDSSYFPPLTNWKNELKTLPAIEGIEYATKLAGRQRGRHILFSEVQALMKSHGLTPLPEHALERLLTDAAIYYRYLDLDGMYRDFGSMTRRARLDLPSERDVASRIVALRASQHLFRRDEISLPLDIKFRLHRCRCSKGCKVMPGQTVCGCIEPAEIEGEPQELVLYALGCLDEPSNRERIPLLWRYDELAVEFCEFTLHCMDQRQLLATVLKKIYNLSSRGVSLAAIDAGKVGPDKSEALIKIQVSGPASSLARLYDDFQTLPLAPVRQPLTQRVRVLGEQLQLHGENALLCEPQTGDSPFQFHGAARDVFVGRASELKEVDQWIKAIRGENSFLVYGIARIGKTAFVQRVHEMCWKSPSLKVVSVKIDTTGLSCSNEDELWTEIAAAIHSQVSGYEAKKITIKTLAGYVRQKGSTNSKEKKLGYSTFLPWLIEHVLPALGNTRLLLLFDELYLLHSRAQRNHELDIRSVAEHLRGLKSLTQEKRNLLFLFCEQLHVAYKVKENNEEQMPLGPVMVCAWTVELGPLSKKTAMQIGSEHVKLSAQSKHEMFRVTAGHPYYMTLFMQRLFSIKSRKLLGLRESREAAQWVAAAAHHFQYFENFVGVRTGCNNIVEAIAILGEEFPEGRVPLERLKHRLVNNAPEYLRGLEENLNYLVRCRIIQIHSEINSYSLLFPIYGYFLRGAEA